MTSKEYIIKKSVILNRAKLLFEEFNELKVNLINSLPFKVGDEHKSIDGNTYTITEVVVNDYIDDYFKNNFIFENKIPISVFGIDKNRHYQRGSKHCIKELSFQIQEDIIDKKLPIDILTETFKYNELNVALVNRFTNFFYENKIKKIEYSRSRRKRWKKGETSGHIQKVREVYIDCDGDAILFKVDQTGAACHENYFSCFFRKKINGKWIVARDKMNRI